MTAVAKRPKVVIRHSLNYVLDNGEQNGMPSMTTPDMTMSISEILQRFAAGRPPSFANNLHYTGEQMLPDMRTLDLVEQDELIKANAERVEALKKSYNEKADLRSKARKEAKERERQLLQKAAELMETEKKAKNGGGTTE